MIAGDVDGVAEHVGELRIVGGEHADETPRRGQFVGVGRSRRPTVDDAASCTDDGDVALDAHVDAERAGTDRCGDPLSRGRDRTEGDHGGGGPGRAADDGAIAVDVERAAEATTGCAGRIGEHLHLRPGRAGSLEDAHGTAVGFTGGHAEIPVGGHECAIAGDRDACAVPVGADDVGWCDHRVRHVRPAGHEVVDRRAPDRRAADPTDDQAGVVAVDRQREPIGGVRDGDRRLGDPRRPVEAEGVDRVVDIGDGRPVAVERDLSAVAVDERSDTVGVDELRVVLPRRAVVAEQVHPSCAVEPGRCCLGFGDDQPVAVGVDARAEEPHVAVARREQLVRWPGDGDGDDQHRTGVRENPALLGEADREVAALAQRQRRAHAAGARRRADPGICRALGPRARRPVVDGHGTEIVRSALERRHRDDAVLHGDGHAEVGEAADEGTGRQRHAGRPDTVDALEHVGRTEQRRHRVVERPTCDDQAVVDRDRRREEVVLRDVTGRLRERGDRRQRSGRHVEHLDDTGVGRAANPGTAGADGDRAAVDRGGEAQLVTRDRLRDHAAGIERAGRTRAVGRRRVAVERHRAGATEDGRGAHDEVDAGVPERDRALLHRDRPAERAPGHVAVDLPGLHPAVVDQVVVEQVHGPVIDLATRRARRADRQHHRAGVVVDIDRRTGERDRLTEPVAGGAVGGEQFGLERPLVGVERTSEHVRRARVRHGAVAEACTHHHDVLVDRDRLPEVVARRRVGGLDQSRRRELDLERVRRPGVCAEQVLAGGADDHRAGRCRDEPAAVREVAGFRGRDRQGVAAGRTDQIPGDHRVRAGDHEHAGVEVDRRTEQRGRGAERVGLHSGRALVDVDAALADCGGHPDGDPVVLGCDRPSERVAGVAAAERAQPGERRLRVAARPDFGVRVDGGGCCQ